MAAARPQGKPTVQIQNERTVTTEWRFAPGAETGWHRHGMDYVVVPMTTGKVLVEEPGGGSRLADMIAGQAYFRGEGVEHNIVNANEFELVFVEIELKK